MARHHGREQFTAGDTAGVRQFATLAALVLHNGRLVHRIREAERMKRDFMNIAVHELRGPLTVIEGYTELLINDEAAHLDDDAMTQLATIRRQAAHARSLAEDLLILARIESHDLGVTSEVMVVDEVVAAAIERALPRARLRSGTVEMRRQRCRPRRRRHGARRACAGQPARQRHRLLDPHARKSPSPSRLTGPLCRSASRTTARASARRSASGSSRDSHAAPAMARSRGRGSVCT